MRKTKYKVGDKVTAFLYKSTMEKIKVVGTIKEIKQQFGNETYVITMGSVEDFPTRTIK